MTLQNGPLNVIPGTHTRSAVRSLARRGVHRGGERPSVEADHADRKRSPIHGPAGSACLDAHPPAARVGTQHTRASPRTLFISEYRAEDSKPLQVNHLPSPYDGEVVRGERTNRVRCSAYEMEYPEVPTTASFFDQQDKDSRIRRET